MMHERLHTSEIAGVLRDFSEIIREFRDSISEEETVFSWDIWARLRERGEVE